VIQETCNFVINFYICIPIVFTNLIIFIKFKIQIIMLSLCMLVQNRIHFQTC